MLGSWHRSGCISVPSIHITRPVVSIPSRGCSDSSTGPTLLVRTHAPHQPSFRCPEKTRAAAAVGGRRRSLLAPDDEPPVDLAVQLCALGLAKTADWSASGLGARAETLRNAEKEAKSARLRIWRDFTPALTAADAPSAVFAGRVVEVSVVCRVVSCVCEFVEWCRTASGECSFPILGSTRMLSFCKNRHGVL